MEQGFLTRDETFPLLHVHESYNQLSSCGDGPAAFTFAVGTQASGAGYSAQRRAAWRGHGQALAPGKIRVGAVVVRSECGSNKQRHAQIKEGGEEEQRSVREISIMELVF